MSASRVARLAARLRRLVPSLDPAGAARIVAAAKIGRHWAGTIDAKVDAVKGVVKRT